MNKNKIYKTIYNNKYKDNPPSNFNICLLSFVTINLSAVFFLSDNHHFRHSVLTVRP